MAFFEAEEKFSRMSFGEFYFEKTNQKRCELKDVKCLEVSFCDISSTDLARMAVVQHLICNNCTIESLKPLLDSPLQKLTLIECKIKCAEEKGQSFAKLQSLALNTIHILKGKEKVRFRLEVALPLEELDYDCYVESINKDIFSKVTQTVRMRNTPCPDVFETLQAHTLIVPYLHGEGPQLPACVKRLVISCTMMGMKTIFPHVEILVADAGSMKLQQFPNLKQLFINNTHLSVVYLEPDELAKLEVLCFHGSFPFREINRPGLCIRQSNKKLTHLCLDESVTDAVTKN